MSVETLSPRHRLHVRLHGHWNVKSIPIFTFLWPCTAIPKTPLNAFYFIKWHHRAVELYQKKQQQDSSPCVAGLPVSSGTVVSSVLVLMRFMYSIRHLIVGREDYFKATVRKDSRSVCDRRFSYSCFDCFDKKKGISYLLVRGFQ